MSDLIVGYGEVGQALAELIPDAEVFDVVDGPPEAFAGSFDWRRVHIAFPWGEHFDNDVRFWQHYAETVIVYSTVPIGTCEALGVVHSPVEGKHPELAESIDHMTRWIGTTDDRQRIAAALFWKKGLGVEVRPVDSADYTEFIKLRSTARYGINIAFANYEAEVAQKIDMPYDLIKIFDRDYNDLYRYLNNGGLDTGRYVLDDPYAKIGGHCVVSNAKILNDQFPDTMLEEIIGYE